MKSFTYIDLKVDCRLSKGLLNSNETNYFLEIDKDI
jgi:hypothetical protein